MPYEFVVRYEPRFGPLLLDGRKRQTIRRAFKHGDRSPDIGDVFVHTVEHSPTKLELIGRSALTTILPITFDVRRGSIQIGRDRLTWSDDRNRFAVDDGFTCPADMQQWFSTKYPNLQVFEGVLYEWEY
jgi:hypothetical protein